MLKFSEFACDIRPLDGIKKKISEVLNKTIVVTNYKIKASQYKKGEDRYATIQAELNGDKIIIFTGSAVLLEQLEKYGEQIPFETQIKQIDKYFTFS